MTSRRNQQSAPSTPANAGADRRDEPPADASFPIVGIGASAGGLEAFTQLLKALPLDTGMGFVLVQHLDPDHESALTQILARATSLPVSEITNDQRVQANHVHVIPPDTSLSIVAGVLKLQPRPPTRTPHRPIDTFFESLAQDRRERAIGVVLSGTASDGTLGLEAIKAEGGIAFAQDDSAKHDSMPRSAVAAGCVDLVLAPAAIAQELARIAQHPYVAGQSHFTLAEDDAATAHEDDSTPLPAGRPPHRNKRGADGEQVRTEAERGTGLPAAKDAEDGYKKILLLLRKHSGVDFSLYKSPTIQRRIARRMVLGKQDTLADYTRFLRGHAQELDALYSDVLISVTSFFRNPETFDALKREVLPRLLRRRGADPVRVWVLGCSTGQEAYSIAIAFMEAAENAPRLRKFQIFATDLNEKLLDKARHGLYARSLADDVTPERLRRFFIEEDGGYRVSKSLREMVVFARHNLIDDPPFSRMDLISCRNLLIYLEPGLQKKALPTFHYALKPDGFLLLGASESVGGFTALFEIVDKKHKIFAKKPAPTPAFHLPVRKERGKHALSPPAPRPPTAAAEPEGLRGERSAQREADRITLNRFGPAGVLINDELQVLQFRGPTGAYLEPASGKASFDVLKMAREGLMLPLRAAVNEARQSDNTARKENARVKRDGETRTVNLEVIPLKNLRERCFLILFEEAQPASAGQPVDPPVTRRSRDADGPRSSREESHRIAELETELSDTREYLQSVQEQHEAVNEELQAANEEAQSANEELQSINEELETSKEELESANEELTTVNEEMSYRNIELNRLNNDLVNLEASTRIAIVLLGRDLSIRRFTPSAEKQFDLLSTDRGRPIRHIRHDLVLAADNPTATAIPLDLEALSAEVIASVHEQQCEVRDKAGRWHLLRMRPYLTLDNKVDGAVLVMVDIDELKRREQAVAAARDYAENIIATVREPLLVLDNDLRVASANRAFYDAFRVTPDETVGRLIYDLGNRQWDIPRLRELLEGNLPQSTAIDDFQVEHDFETLGARIMQLSVRRMVDPQVQKELILLAIEDVTERKRMEAALRNSEIRYRRLFESAKDGILILDAASGKIIDANPFMTELLGYSHDDFYDKELWEIGLFSDKPASETAMRELQEKGFIRYEHLPLESDRGKRVEVEIVANAYGEDHHKVIQCNIRDMTERSRMEQKLREQAEALADLHRRKDEFLAMLGHELRNPLAPITNAVELLRLQTDEDPLQQQARTIIARQMGQLTHLVDDLLEVARITTGRVHLHQERLALNGIVEHAIETVRPLIRQRRHSLDVSLSPQSVWLRADATRIEQVIVNLLTNAAKYTHEGGRIWLAVQQEGDEAVLRVRDSGVGIAPELLPCIFDLFTQSKRSLDRSKGGLGIGLSLVRRLVEMHQGRVEVFSALGQGSEFVVRLPAVTTRAPAPAPAPAAEQTQPTGPSLQVLVVDDNEDMAMTLALLLRASGHDVRTAHDGQTALDAALADRPDAVLLDIGLPGLDGYEVARRMRRQPVLRNTMLVAMTGYGRETDRQRAQEVGFEHHLVKPADFRKVQEILATVAKKTT